MPFRELLEDYSARDLATLEELLVERAQASKASEPKQYGVPKYD